MSTTSNMEKASYYTTIYYHLSYMWLWWFITFCILSLLAASPKALENTFFSKPNSFKQLKYLLVNFYQFVEVSYHTILESYCSTSNYDQHCLTNKLCTFTNWLHLQNYHIFIYLQAILNANSKSCTKFVCMIYIIKIR